MAALDADENFPGPAVVALRTAGLDVLTALEDGRANLGISDPDVLTRARALGRAVLTNNRKDYFRLHKANAAHAGIIACKEDLDFPALAARIHAVLSSVADLTGQLIRINKPNPPQSP